MLKYVVMQKEEPKIPEDHDTLCPICEGALSDEQKTKSGWNCACGEFVPKGCHIPPRVESGCGCNALAAMKKSVATAD